GALQKTMCQFLWRNWKHCCHRRHSTTTSRKINVPDISSILSKALSGDRLTQAEGVLLMEKADLNQLGQAALAIRRKKHPAPIATYVVDRNINYTNVCVADCDFCAFYRRPGDVESYVLPREELYQKIRELKAI